MQNFSASIIYYIAAITRTRKARESAMDFMRDLAEYIKGRKVVVVFGEFPYMVKRDESFEALAQYFIDMQPGGSKLIIPGSSIKTMVYETTDYSRPLYGCTRHLWLRAMPIQECTGFHPNLPDL